MREPEKNKELLQRWGHGAAAVTVNSDYVEVILLGGDYIGYDCKDTVVATFGESVSVPLIHFF